MEDQEIEDWKKKIDAMSQTEMAQLWRFAPSGHPIFSSPLYDYFNVRFNSLGGFTPGISKAIGWRD